MNEDLLRELFDHYNLGSTEQEFNEFKTGMSDPKNARAFFDSYELGNDDDFKEFVSYLGIGTSNQDFLDVNSIQITPQQDALLRAIQDVEAKQNQGWVGFGGEKIPKNLKDHPRKVFGKTKYGTTTAAGPYQFTATTWDFTQDLVEKKTGKRLGAFGQKENDIAALVLAEYEYERRSGGGNIYEDLSTDPEKVRKVLAGKGASTVWQGLQTDKTFSDRYNQYLNIQSPGFYEKPFMLKNVPQKSDTNEFAERDAKYGQRTAPTINTQGIYDPGMESMGDGKEESGDEKTKRLAGASVELTDAKKRLQNSKYSDVKNIQQDVEQNKAVIKNDYINGFVDWTTGEIMPEISESVKSRQISPRQEYDYRGAVSNYSLIVKNSSELLKDRYGDSFVEEYSTAMNSLQKTSDQIKKLEKTIKAKKGTVPEVEETKPLMESIDTTKSQINEIVAKAKEVSLYQDSLLKQSETLKELYNNGDLSYEDYVERYNTVKDAFDKADVERESLKEQESKLLEVHNSSVEELNKKSQDYALSFDSDETLKTYYNLIDKFNSEKKIVEKYDNDPIFLDFKNSYVALDELNKQRKFLDPVGYSEDVRNALTQRKADIMARVNVPGENQIVNIGKPYLNKLGQWGIELGSQVLGLAQLAAEVVPSIPGTEGISAQDRENAILSLESAKNYLQMGKNRMDAFIPSNLKGEFMFNYVDPDGIKNILPKNIDKIQVKNGEVIDFRDKDNFIITPDLTEEQEKIIADYVKQKEDDVKTDYGVQRLFVNNVETAADVVAMLYGGAGAAKLIGRTFKTLSPMAASTTGVGLMSFAQQLNSNITNYLGQGLSTDDAIKSGVLVSGATAAVESLVGPLESKIVSRLNGKLPFKYIEDKKIIIADLAAGKIGAKNATDALTYSLINAAKEVGLENFEEILGNEVADYIDSAILGTRREEMDMLDFKNQFAAVTLISLPMAGFSVGRDRAQRVADIRSSFLYNSIKNREAFNKTVDDFLSEFDEDILLTDEQKKLKTNALFYRNTLIPYIESGLSMYPNLTDAQGAALTGLFSHRFSAQQQIAKEKKKEVPNDIVIKKSEETLKNIENEIEEIVKGNKKVEENSFLKDETFTNVEDKNGNGKIVYKFGTGPEVEYKVGDKVNFGSLGEITITAIGQDKDGNFTIDYSKEDTVTEQAPTKTFLGRDITDGKKIFTDFDNTLYDPKTGQLTAVGKELREKLDSGELTPDDVEILTARDAEQAGDIAKLFPELTIKSGLSPEAKAAEVAKAEGNSIFIDDNKENLSAAAGKGEVIDSATVVPQTPREVVQEDIQTIEGVNEGVEKRKSAQLEIINNSNPAPNSYNLWARSVDDIKTAEEAFQGAFEDGAMYDDFGVDEMQNALKSGKVTVYSSYPIKEGVFVSPSKQNAQEYAGGKGGKLYSKEVSIDDIAWLDEGDGQYAPVKATQETKTTDTTQSTTEPVNVQQGSPDTATEPILTTTLPGSSAEGTYVKDGDKWFVAKKDGTPSKREVKKPEFINHLNDAQATKNVEPTSTTTTPEIVEPQPSEQATKAPLSEIKDVILNNSTNTGKLPKRTYTKVGNNWQYMEGGKPKTVRSKNVTEQLDKLAAPKTKTGEVAPAKRATPAQELTTPEDVDKKIKDIVKKMQGLKGKKPKGARASLFGLDLIATEIGLPLWNRAVDFAIGQVEKGTSFGKAVAATVDFIDSSLQGKKWNKEGFKKGFESYLADNTSKQVDTILEPIGKDAKEREEQIYKFFALPSTGGDKVKARELAKITNKLWENVAFELGKRNMQAANDWVQSRVAMMGKTSVEGARAMGGVFQESQEYFTRNADRLPLTLSVFKRPEFVKMQGKMVNPITVLNSLNQSGIKQIEKDLIKNIIEENYKSQKNISYDELEATVRANIMPLERIFTSSYASYGMDNLGNGNYGEANTIILNAPIEHGVTGHFSGAFKTSGRKNIKYVPKQLNDNTWVAVEEGYESQANDNNIYQFVGTAGTKEAVDAWIIEYNKVGTIEITEEDISKIRFINNEIYENDSTGERDYINGRSKEDIVRESKRPKELNKGMFGHIRVWQDGQDFYVAELQSDYFQKNNARTNILGEKIRRAKELVIESYDKKINELFEGENREYFTEDFITDSGEVSTAVKKFTNGETVKTFIRTVEAYDFVTDGKYSRLQNEKQKDINKVELNIFSSATLQEKQFIASRKSWEQRMVREAIKEAALSGATSLRFPTPYTLSVIEGYITPGESTLMPYTVVRGDSDFLQPGDMINYAGEFFIIVSANDEEIEVVAEDKVKIEKDDSNWNKDLSTQNEEGYINGNLVYLYYKHSDAERLSSPNQYYGNAKSALKEDFDIENDLSGTQQTVARKYEQIAEILKQERGEENVEIVTDENGFDWYETKISPNEVNNPVVAFQSQQPITTVEAATNVANNLITELDRMIKERSDKNAIKEKGLTLAQAAQQVKDLKAVKAELQSNMKDLRWQVDAYHGTPYVFDKFTTDKIGTGEGAQAFGWGLYFTDLESIARNYAKNLSTQNVNVISKEIVEAIKQFNLPTKLLKESDWAIVSDMLLANNFDTKKVIEELNQYLVRTIPRKLLSSQDVAKEYEKINILDALQKNGFEVKAKTRNLYKVSLHKGKTPDKYTWLEWDRPVSEKVKNIVKSKLSNEQRDFVFKLPQKIDGAKPKKGSDALFDKGMELLKSRGGQDIWDQTDQSIINTSSTFLMNLLDLRKSKATEINDLKDSIENDPGSFRDVKDLGALVKEREAEVKKELSDLDSNIKAIEHVQISLLPKTVLVENDNLTGDDLYTNLELLFKSPKDASIFLLENGIDGIKYPAESISRGATSDTARGFNYVVFDENAVTIEERIQFQQEAAKFRAAAIEVAKNQVIIAALDAPNASSFVHEMAHSFEPDLTADERQTFIDEYNQKFGDKVKGWNTDVSEYFARLWEKYLSNGRQLSEADVKDEAKRGVIQEIFDKFTEYLKGIYNGVIEYTNTKGIKREINISPEVQTVFDKVMGIDTQQEITKSTTKTEALANLKQAAKNFASAWITGYDKLGIYFDPKEAAINRSKTAMELFDALVDLIKVNLSGSKFSKQDLVKLVKDNYDIDIDLKGASYLFDEVNNPGNNREQVKTVGELRQAIDDLREEFEAEKEDINTFREKVSNLIDSMRDKAAETGKNYFFSMAELKDIANRASKVFDEESLQKFSDFIENKLERKDVQQIKSKIKGIRGIANALKGYYLKVGKSPILKDQLKNAAKFNFNDRRTHKNSPFVLNATNKKGKNTKAAMEEAMRKIHIDDVERFYEFMTNLKKGVSTVDFFEEAKYFAGLYKQQLAEKTERNSIKNAQFDENGNLIEGGVVITEYNDLPKKYKDEFQKRGMLFGEDGNAIDSDGNIVKENKDLTSLEQDALNRFNKNKRAEEKKIEKINKDEELRAEIIDEINDIKSRNREKISDPAFQKLIDSFLSLTDADIANATTDELNKLLNGYNSIVNTNNPGKDFENVLSEVTARRKAEDLVNLMKTRSGKFRILLRDLIRGAVSSKTKVQQYENIIKKKPLRRLDSIFKGRDGSEFFEKTVNQIASGFGVFTAFNNKIKKELRDNTKGIKARDQIRLKLYAIDRQHKNNPESKEIKSLEQEMQDAELYASNDTNYQLGTYAIAKEIYEQEKAANGGVFDYEKMELSDAEKKLLDYIDNKFVDNQGKVLVSGSRTNKDTKTYFFYTPLDRMKDLDKVSQVSNFAEATLEGKNIPINNMTAGNVNARTKTKLPIRDWNIVTSSYESMKETELDYQMRQPLKDFGLLMKNAILSFNNEISNLREQIKNETNEDTIKKLKEDLETAINNRDFLDATANVVKDVSKEQFMQQFDVLTASDRVSEFLAEIGYGAVLASVPRAGAEFLSNLGFAFFYFKDFTTGLKYVANPKNLGKIYEFVTRNPSTQQTRLLAHTGSLRADRVETPGLGKNVQYTSKIKNAALDAVDSYKSIMSSINDGLNSVGDRAVALPLWMGSFDRAFNKARRQEIEESLNINDFDSREDYDKEVKRLLKEQKFDLDKFLNDPDYEFENRDTIDKALKKADDNLSQGFSSFNPFEGIADLKSGAKKGFLDNFNSFLQRFIRFEYQSAEDAVNALMGRGSMSRSQGLALLTATLTRMTAYTLISKILKDLWEEYVTTPLFDAILSPLGAGATRTEKDIEREVEDGKTSELTYDLRTALLGSVAQLVTGRHLGALWKIPINAGIEAFNIVKGEDLGLRSGPTYEAWKNSLVWSTFKFPKLESLEEGSEAAEELKVKENKYSSMSFGGKDIISKKIDAYKYLLQFGFAFTGQYSPLANAALDVSVDIFRKAKLDRETQWLRDLDPIQQKAISEMLWKYSVGSLATAIIPLPAPRDIKAVLKNTRAALDFGPDVDDKIYKKAKSPNATKADINAGLDRMKEIRSEQYRDFDEEFDEYLINEVPGILEKYKKEGGSKPRRVSHNNKFYYYKDGEWTYENGDKMSTVRKDETKELLNSLRDRHAYTEAWERIMIDMYKKTLLTHIQPEIISVGEFRLVPKGDGTKLEIEQGEEPGFRFGENKRVFRVPLR